LALVQKTHKLAVGHHHQYMPEVEAVQNHMAAVVQQNQDMPPMAVVEVQIRMVVQHNQHMQEATEYRMVAEAYSHHIQKEPKLV
jgi:hypothetical protein